MIIITREMETSVIVNTSDMMVNTSVENITHLEGSVLSNDNIIWLYNEKLFEANKPVVGYLIVMAMLGIFGNGSVVYIYSFRFKRNTVNFFILLLGMFDVIAASMLCLEAVDRRFPMYSGTFPALCKAVRLIEFIVNMWSAGILVCISFDRYYKICHPMKSFTMSKAKKLIIAVMVSGAFFAWPTGIFHGPQTQYTGIPGVYGMDCADDDNFRSMTVMPLYYIALMILNVVLFVLLIVMYALLYKEIWKWKHEKVGEDLDKIKSKSVRSVSEYMDGSVDKTRHIHFSETKDVFESDSESINAFHLSCLNGLSLRQSVKQQANGTGPHGYSNGDIRSGSNQLDVSFGSCSSVSSKGDTEPDDTLETCQQSEHGSQICLNKLNSHNQQSEQSGCQHSLNTDSEQSDQVGYQLCLSHQQHCEHCGSERCLKAHHQLREHGSNICLNVHEQSENGSQFCLNCQSNSEQQGCQICLLNNQQNEQGSQHCLAHHHHQHQSEHGSQDRLHTEETSGAYLNSTFSSCESVKTENSTKQNGFVTPTTDGLLKANGHVHVTTLMVGTTTPDITSSPQGSPRLTPFTLANTPNSSVQSSPRETDTINRKKSTNVSLNTDKEGIYIRNNSVISHFSSISSAFRKRLSRGSNSSTKHRTPKSAASLAHSTLLFAVITAAFILSYLPYFIIEILNATGMLDMNGDMSLAAKQMYRLANSSFCINTAINPIIYSILNPAFKKQLKIIFCGNERQTPIKR